MVFLRFNKKIRTHKQKGTDKENYSLFLCFFSSPLFFKGILLFVINFNFDFRDESFCAVYKKKKKEEKHYENEKKKKKS